MRESTVQTPPQESKRAVGEDIGMGMNARTGAALSGPDHLKQSIKDILTTPLGSRVMRRQYGSELFDLIDAPTNRRMLAAIYAATAGALRRWEPRFLLQRVALDAVRPGGIVLTLHGRYRYNGEAGSLSMSVEVTK